MTTRKTDDNIILQMLQEGKSQKEIAEHFGVSPAAVCKRVKKINSVLKVEKSLGGLTDTKSDLNDLVDDVLKSLKV